jgi:hypothetical protein
MQQKQIIHSQIEILYSQSVSTFLFPAIASIILAFALWEVANQGILIVWVSVVCLYSVIRYFVLWKYMRSDITPENASKWLDIFIGTACLSGIMWGLAAIILIPHEGKNLIEFTLYTGITLLIVSGLVAGATISYSISLTVLFFYVLPTLLPPAFYLISLGDIYNSTLGGFILLYCFFISTAGFRMNRQLLSYIHKQHELEVIKRQHHQLKLLYEKVTTRTQA